MNESQKRIAVSLEPDNEHMTMTVELGRFFARNDDGKIVASMAISARIVMEVKSPHYADAMGQLAHKLNMKIREWQAEQIALTTMKESTNGKG